MRVVQTGSEAPASVAQPADAHRRRHEEPGGDLARRDARSDAGHKDRAGHGLDLAQGRAEDGREQRFRESLKRHASGAARAATAGRTEDDDDPGRRLLAERPPLPPFPLAATAVALAPATLPTQRAERICDLVEAALRRSGAPTPGTPVVIALDAPLLIGSGLAGILITMGADALDVVLSPEPGADVARLMDTAQTLADRLQQRFGRRVIRIHEGPRGAAEPDATSASGSTAPVAGPTGWRP
ncbi:hypothetical protein [uncultured Aureimonas sp.]|uniref:hypothetical protein n=1 Tax=uncultured Aureimonas sp. TaxID=1604662 RepID=UPI0025D9D09F|nr:hypothetical protein [uncultured Aureimonas sp.]